MSNYSSRYKCSNFSIGSNIVGNNPVNVNSGGGIAMKKKYAHKFSKVSSNTNFSINNSNNNNYIGNPNTAIAFVGCKQSNTNVKPSVKNYSGYIRTRIVDDKIKTYPHISSYCSVMDPSFNKHFSNTSDSTNVINKLKIKCRNLNNDDFNSKCYLGNNLDEYANRVNQNNIISNIPKSNYNQLNKCNLTKDETIVKFKIPGYDTYYNNLFYKKMGLYNPPNAKTIAC